MGRRGHGYLDWEGVQLIMGGTLPSPCTAFSQSLSVNSFRRRFQGERANLVPRVRVALSSGKGNDPCRWPKGSRASGNEIVTSADLIDACAYKMPSCSTAREENMLRGHQTVERWRGGSSSIACSWCHGGHVGGEGKKNFSPLATLFSCKSFTKRIVLYWPSTWPPCHVVSD